MSLYRRNRANGAAVKGKGIVPSRRHSTDLVRHFTSVILGVCVSRACKEKGATTECFIFFSRANFILFIFSPFFLLLHILFCVFFFFLFAEDYNTSYYVYVFANVRTYCVALLRGKKKVFPFYLSVSLVDEKDT